MRLDNLTVLDLAILPAGDFIADEGVQAGKTNAATSLVVINVIVAHMGEIIAIIENTNS